MSDDQGTVFVFGAGFTRAFLPRAPLMEDDYNGKALLEKFERFPQARGLLELEMDTEPRGRINIERLMTRLDGKMPYDTEHRAMTQYDELLSELKQCFRAKLEDAKKEQPDETALKALALHCREHKITCVTFNYDDIFDRALHEAQGDSPGWGPDTGYGFYCQGASAWIDNSGIFYGGPPMHLLKLHGSVNWYPKFGYSPPYTPDAIVHYENWVILLSTPDPETLRRHFEQDPFIVPPVLVKSDLVDQPTLRMIWSLAYDALKASRKVVFIGYSLPATDLASAFLFRESLRNPRPSIRVINYAPDDKKKRQQVKERYRDLFPWLEDHDFDFNGALAWARVGMKLSESN